METNELLAFLALAIPLGAVPGPDWMFMLTAATRYRVVAPAAIGLTVAHLMIVAAIAAGVGPLVTVVPQLMAVLAVVGGAYLIHLGTGVLRSIPATGADASTSTRYERNAAENLGAGPEAGAGIVVATAPAAVHRQVMRQGLGVAGLNPKAWLFYLILVPQFATATAPWPLAVQMAVLGLIFAASCMASAIVVGVLAERVIGPRPRLSRIISRIAGVIMLALGASLLAEQALHLAGH